jgi:hypothetical protein
MRWRRVSCRVHGAQDHDGIVAGRPRIPADVHPLILEMSFADAPVSGGHVSQIGADLRAQAAGLAFELLC